MMLTPAMPPTHLESPPETLTATSLEYVRASAPVTRRQFRFLLFLTLLNTILLAIFICGPAASSFIRASWQEYQAKQRLRQAQQANEAVLRQASAFVAPADQVVYEENPELWKSLPDAQDFLAAPRAYADVTPFFRKDPSVFPPQLRRMLSSDPSDGPTVFLHPLKNSAGQDRFIWIVLRVRQEAQRGARSSFAEGEIKYQVTINNQRYLTAMLIEHDVAKLKTTSLATIRPHIPDLKTTLTYKGDPKLDKNPTIDRKGVFRFYAGQLDPKDPTHFTIDYAIDGQRNTLDGYLKNDNTLVFTPRTGQITNSSGNDMIWNPLAAPATQTSK